MTGASRLSLLTTCPSCEARTLIVVEMDGGFAGGECGGCGKLMRSVPAPVEATSGRAGLPALVRHAPQLPAPAAVEPKQPEAAETAARPGVMRAMLSGAAQVGYVVTAVALLAALLYRGLPIFDAGLGGTAAMVMASGEQGPPAVSAPATDVASITAAPSPAPARGAVARRVVSPAAAVIGDPGVASLIDLKRRLPEVYPDPREGMMARELASFRAAAAAEASEAELALSAQRRREVQRRLLLAGHDPMGVDGVFGPATRAAIAAWQREVGIPASGHLGERGLALLEDRTEQAFLEWKSRSRHAEPAQAAPAVAQQPGTEVVTSDRCRRDDGGEIAFGSNFRCDVAGLRQSLGALRQNLDSLFRGGDAPPAASPPGRSGA